MFMHSHLLTINIHTLYALYHSFQLAININEKLFDISY